MYHRNHCTKDRRGNGTKYLVMSRRTKFDMVRTEERMEYNKTILLQKFRRIVPTMQNH